jgi:hypothetical protein
MQDEFHAHPCICSGGRPRFAPTVSSGGLTALPRQHPSMTATWQPSRRGPCLRADMLEALLLAIYLSR